MPRGSKIGERRGGREFGTPNRRTVLANRILALAPEHPKASASQFVDILVQDRQLPADIRMAILQNFQPAGRSRSAAVGAARSSANRPQMSKSAGPLPAPSGTAKPAAMDMLFSITQDMTVQQDQRRKAALAAAQYFLPKTLGEKRWWVNAPRDEFGFAITPQIAAEYRDIKIELRCLQGNDPATTRKAAAMQKRLKAIMHRLQCPSPTLYGKHQRTQDGLLLLYSLQRREDNKTLDEEQNAAEAHCRARCDCYDQRPEMAAMQRLSTLENKERIFRNAFGPRLTRKEKADLRFLRRFYSQPRESPPGLLLDDKSFYLPLRDEPLAADGNLYPPNSKLAPVKDGDIIEEFVDVPPYVIGNPNYPGHTRLW